MSAFDEKPLQTPGPPVGPGAERAPEDVPEPGERESASETTAESGERGIESTSRIENALQMGEPNAAEPARVYLYKRALPQDLQVPWSWAHFFVFLFFTFASFIVVQTALALFLAPNQRLSAKEYEQYLLSKPQFVLGTNVLWYAMIFLFLWVTLAVLRGEPFWESLGWRKWKSSAAGRTPNPLFFFAGGCGLAVFVAVASSRMQGNENMPIQELFKSRTTALLLMAMAVFLAPLVEETIFRGYLYPLFAKSFGVATSIVLTGVLFGLMHGSQLAWSWGIVSMLVFVGIVFTFIRAWAGTVWASFLMHLGYNTAIAITSILATKGFTQLPPLR